MSRNYFEPGSIVQIAGTYVLVTWARMRTGKKYQCHMGGVFPADVNEGYVYELLERFAC